MGRIERTRLMHVTGRTLRLMVALTVLVSSVCTSQSKRPSVQAPAHRTQSKPALRPDTTLTRRPDSTLVLHPDSAKTHGPDSTLVHRPDSLIKWDLRTWAGSLALTVDSTGALTAEEMEWLAPMTLGHAIATLPGVYLVEQSSVGQYMRPTVRGVDWRGVGVTIDGLPAADPSSGVVNLSLFPVSIADRVEIVSGSRSFLYGSGAVGGAVNIVTHRASHTVPATAIRYEESGYSYACSDGSFNQDISRRVNVAAGFQYQGTEGRFDNTGHEQWNMRGAVRYNPAQNWDITASYLYVQTQTGLSEGIDVSTTGTALAFLPQQATVRNPDAYEKLTRHDVALKLAGSLFGDSTNLTTASLYTSQILREYRDEENRTSPNGVFIQQDHRVARSGLQVKQRSVVGSQTVTGGLQAEIHNIIASPTMGGREDPAFSGWLLDEIAFTPGVIFSLFGRLDHIRGTTHNGIGTDLHVQLGDVVSLIGGFSVAARPSSYAEAFWEDSTVLRGMLPEIERHTQWEAGMQLDLGALGTVGATYAYRRIENPVLFDVPVISSGEPHLMTVLRQGDELTIHSLELALNMRIGFIMVEGIAAYEQQTDAANNRIHELPEMYARGGIYYHDRILGNALELQAGVRGQAQTSYYGSTLLGQTLFPLPNLRVKLGAASTLDLVLIAHIGDAYIHFLWENLTNSEYFTTPFTPAMDRSIRFGVSWEFLN